MASQTSFRLPPAMLRALAKLARQRGVPKSQLVREAIEQYLDASSSRATSTLTVRERIAPYVGSISLEPRSTDDVAAYIRRQNWRA